VGDAGVEGGVHHGCRLPAVDGHTEVVAAQPDDRQRRPGLAQRPCLHGGEPRGGPRSVGQARPSQLAFTMTVVAEPGRTRWTVDDVLKLAPDAGSAGAARRLSLSAVWSQAGSSGSLLWGKCQGSAREPYQVPIDLNEPSFRCTCPSRKHPCKHGLALLLLWAEGDGSVAEEARPAEFAAEWVQRLAAKAPAGRVAAPPDPEAQARRLAQRLET